MRSDFMRRLFAEHPAGTGESYGQHLLFTVVMAGRFVTVGGILLLHGLLPCLMTHTASDRIARINRIMQARVAKARGLAAAEMPDAYLCDGI